MTYGRLKGVIRVFLTGDNVLPKDPEDVLAALEVAFIQIANQTTALKLLTPNIDSTIIRQGPGNFYVRMPVLPDSDADELDIDNELVPAVGRIIASYISKDKSALHSFEAEKLIRDYESKVRAYMDELAREDEDYVDA